MPRPTDHDAPDAYAARAGQDDPAATIIGRSAAMTSLHKVIRKVAASQVNVLIEGESGTGKELVARAIHDLGPRGGGVFLGENCAALSETLIESELFGHVRGAFTGADRDRRGLFALASGGTLFLDEVGDLSARIQAKLLRVLQEGEFRPLGGRDLVRTDLRIISATNRDLRTMVEAGEFRGDLYYRLNVVGLRLPPLRERPEDVGMLAEHFLSQVRGEAPRGFSREAMEMMTRYPWPGNVRELQNVVERAAVMASGETIGVEALPEPVIDFALAERAESTGVPGRPKPHEQVMIEETLIRFRGDKTKTASFIGWTAMDTEKTPMKTECQAFRLDPPRAVPTRRPFGVVIAPRTSAAGKAPYEMLG